MGKETKPISEEDNELIKEATNLLIKFFEPGKHEVCCAIRTSSGETFSSINLRTQVGLAGIHCEPICMANAIMEGQYSFETFVAVTRDGYERDGEIKIISACGVCREIIRDYNPAAYIIIPSDDGPVKRTVTDLLPERPEFV